MGELYPPSSPLLPRLGKCEYPGILPYFSGGAASFPVVLLDVTSPVKLVRKICTWFQASPGNSDSANWPGYEAGGGEQSVLCPRFEMDSRDF